MALPGTLPIASFADLLRVSSATFMQGWQQQRSATGGGDTRYADRAPSLWTAEITTPPMEHAEAEGLMALANSRAGGLKTVLLYNPKQSHPSSDPDGAWILSGSRLDIGETSVNYDFQSGTYEKEGAAVSAASVVSCSRASTALAIDMSGAWTEFAANAARITDRGLLVEPAATNLLTRSNDPSNSAWSNKENITVGATVGGWTPIRETVTNSFHRLFRANTTSVIGPHTHTVWIKKAGRRYIGGRVTANGGAIYYNVGFDLDTVAITHLPAGFTATIEKFGDVFRLTWSYTSSSINLAGGLFTASTAITNDALPTFVGDVGQGFDFYNAQIEATAFGTSPIVTAAASASRAADVVALALPAGTHDLSITRADAVVVAAGQFTGYAVPATQPRVLQQVTGIKTALTPFSPASVKLGAIADRLHVAFTGFPADYVIPLGTYFSIVFDTSRYYLGQFVEARTANGAGAVASVEIWPPLPASVAGALDVTLVKSPGKFRLVPGSAYPSSISTVHSVLKLSAEQTYSP